MEEYLIDNNVISNYLSGRFSDSAMEFVANIFDKTPNISVITEIEALSWINDDKKKEAVIKQFISDSNVISLSQNIINKTIALRRNKKIKTPDAIIASTAIISNLILLTSDTGFQKIEALTILNPLEIL
jgi:predicted nucleic acid-binding protein